MDTPSMATKVRNGRMGTSRTSRMWLGFGSVTAAQRTVNTTVLSVSGSHLLAHRNCSVTATVPPPPDDPR
jgi:hypothetical protein